MSGNYGAGIGCRVSGIGETAPDTRYPISVLIGLAFSTKRSSGPVSLCINRGRKKIAVGSERQWPMHAVLCMENPIRFPLLALSGQTIFFLEVEDLIQLTFTEDKGPVKTAVSGLGRPEFAGLGDARTQTREGKRLSYTKSHWTLSITSQDAVSHSGMNSGRGRTPTSAGRCWRFGIDARS